MTAFLDRPIRWRIAASLAALLAAGTFFLAAYPSVRASWRGVSQFQDDDDPIIFAARDWSSYLVVLGLGVFMFLAS
jgi:hypothetical protein